MMTKTSAQKTISIVIAAELVVIATNLISYKFFLNAQISFISAFLIILGSMYSYKRLVEKRLEVGAFGDERDEIDKIEDPYDLYDEENVTEAADAEKDMKTIIKEEKKRLKANAFKNTKLASGATVSLFRILPYAFLVFGFLGLQSNHNLMVLPYLLFLIVGVLCGFLTGRKIFLPSQL